MNAVLISIAVRLVVSCGLSISPLILQGDVEGHRMALQKKLTMDRGGGHSGGAIQPINAFTLHFH